MGDSDQETKRFHLLCLKSTRFDENRTFLNEIQKMKIRENCPDFLSSSESVSIYSSIHRIPVTVLVQPQPRRPWPRDSITSNFCFLSDDPFNRHSWTSSVSSENVTRFSGQSIIKCLSELHLKHCLLVPC